MGSKHFIFAILVGIAAYRWYPATEHNVLVLVNAKTLDLSMITQIRNLKAAFKIDRNVDEYMARGNKEELKAKVFRN